MKCFLVAFAICAFGAAQARPSLHHGGFNSQLSGIPGLDHYEKLVYPNFGLQDLGSEVKGHIPPDVVTVHKTVQISVPHPVHVPVPHKVPYPVSVPKPYPVPITKIVEVPKHIPVEVIKKVPVPIEVPKPYPVPSNEHSQSGHGNFENESIQKENFESGSYGNQYSGGNLGNYEHLQNYGGYQGQGGEQFSQYGSQESEEQFSPSYGVPQQGNYEGHYEQSAEQSSGHLSIASGQENYGNQGQLEQSQEKSS